jgi:cytochrome c oxidase assembly factor CtaG
MATKGHDDEFKNIQLFSRFVLVSFFVLLYLYREVADQRLEEFWDFLRTQAWFRHDSFEPILSTISFATWIWLYYIIDLWNLLKKYRINTSEERDLNWDWM